MKIKLENQFGLSFFEGNDRDNLVENHMRDWERKYGKPRNEWEPEHIKRLGFAKSLLDDTNNKNLVVSQRAGKLIEGIQIEPAKMNLNVFAIIKEKKRTFLIGENRFYRFMVHGNEIFCAIVQKIPQGEYTKIDYLMFPINTEKGYIDVDFEQLGYDAIAQFYEDIIYLFQLLVFTELAETEIVELQPQQKTGTRKSGKIFNDSHSDIIIVDANWNKYVFRSEGFNVRSHFRWQPCGADRSDRKLVFIEEFRKKGYSRRPTKELAV